jgi:hypothetical protein
MNASPTVLPAELESDSRTPVLAARNLGIYDFGVLPYALGDVLTWCMKLRIRGQLDGCRANRVVICASPDHPAGIHQAGYIKPENYHSYLTDILPAFLCGGDQIDLQISTDRAACWQQLASLERGSSHAALAYQDYRTTWKHRTTLGRCNEFFQRQISGHEDLNAYFASAGTLPWLAMPIGIRNTVRELRKELNRDGMFVALNFRSRAHDNTADQAESERDADTNLWLNLVREAGRVIPHVTFVLLGKITEKPDALFRESNVFVPRVFGASLADELAWVNEADCFLGSSSGFAAMANFGTKPYLITKVGKSARRNYCIGPNDDRLPFAQENQLLVDGECDVARLLAFLEQVGANRKVQTQAAPFVALQELFQETRRETQAGRGATMAEAEQEFAALVKGGCLQAAQSLLDGKIRRLAKDREAKMRYHLLRGRYYLSLGSYPMAKEEVIIVERLGGESEETRRLKLEINAHLLLENVDRFIFRNPDASGNFCGANLVRARALMHLGQTEEALQTVEEHLEHFGDDTLAQELRATLTALLGRATAETRA